MSILSPLINMFVCRYVPLLNMSVCRYVVCISFAFTPVAGVQSCAGCHLLFKGKQPNVTVVLFYLRRRECHCWSKVFFEVIWLCNIQIQHK